MVHRNEPAVPVANADAHAPTSKFYTADDEARSLHHLMCAGWRPEPHDGELEPRARRRFAFRCGYCGTRHVARVWDIATQRRCRRCETLMIVPVGHGETKTHSPADTAPSVSSAPPSATPMRPTAEDRLIDAHRRGRPSAARHLGLYCPHCGGFCRAADATRREPAWCAGCRLTF